MERNFSYDDIAGTIWHGGYDPGFGVETTGAGNEDEDGFMKRSESEFAFQEFIKRSLPKDAFTIVSSDDEGEKDVDIPYPPVRNGAERAEDYTDALVPDGAGINGAPSLEDRSNPSGQKPDYATPTGKPSAPKVDGHVNLSPFKPKETAEKSSCEEPEINALLNPLFSGLRSEMIPTAAGRDQQYYQEKLDELCQHARKHRGGALSLTEPAQDHVGSLQARAAAPGQLGSEGASSRTSSGGLTPEGQGIPNKPVTSGSSQDQTDDDEIDNEQNLEPGDKKRVKRMLSNRESARRSRRRKQAHLNDLESQVAQLRVQNSTLSESLQSTTQKLKDASKDNLQLKTYVEMLKAKLIAVNTLHRQLTINGANLQSHSRSPLGAQEMSIASRGFGWESALHNMQPPRVSPYLMNPHVNPAALGEMKTQQHDMEQQSISLTVQQGMKMSRTPSMQRVGSTDHLKKKNRNAPSSTSWDGMNFADLEGPSMIPQFTLSSDY